MIKKINLIEEFDLNIKSTAICMVQFSTTWCPSCKTITPLFEKWSAQNPNVLCIYIDCEESPDIIKLYGVKNIPAFIVFQDGVFHSINTKVRDFDSILPK